MQITFTDAEQRFAASPQGMMQLALARSKHDMSQAYKGSHAAPWTDAMEARAVRILTTEHARAAVRASAALADAARQEPVLRAARDTALAMHNERMTNAWRGDR